MSSVGGIRIQGGEKLLARLNKLEALPKQQAIADAVQAAAATYQQKVILKVEEQGIHDTGDLGSNIQIYTSGKEAMVTAEMEYAIYHEFGTGIYAESGDGRQTPWVYFYQKLGHFVTTVGMRARPFFRPVIQDDAVAKEAGVAAALHLKRAIDKAVS